MSSPANAVRHRGGEKGKKRPGSSGDDSVNGIQDLAEKAKGKVKAASSSDWDYKLGLAIITILGFVTRFWGITHPKQVVFDEVHFGKVGVLRTRLT